MPFGIAGGSGSGVSLTIDHIVCRIALLVAWLVKTGCWELRDECEYAAETAALGREWR